VVRSFFASRKLACSGPDLEAMMAADEIFVMVLVLVCVLIVGIMSVRSRGKVKRGNSNG